MSRTASPRSKAEKRISELITDADAEAALRSLREGLKATRKAREGSRGAIIYGQAPDFSVRTFCAVKLLEFKFGRPASQLVLSGGAEHPQIDTPELIRQLVGAGGADDLKGIIDQYIIDLPRAEHVPAHESQKQLQNAEPRELAEV